MDHHVAAAADGSTTSATVVITDDLAFYRVERSAALKNVIVNLLPSSKFYDWLRLNGKDGAQGKFPRVLKNEVLESWRNHVKNK